MSEGTKERAETKYVGDLTRASDAFREQVAVALEELAAGVRAKKFTSISVEYESLMPPTIFPKMKEGHDDT